MIKSSLAEIIGSLTPKEFKIFGEFIRSPVFNKNQSVIKLYDYIRRHFPELEEENFKKEEIYKKLFPGSKYNVGSMKTIVFNLSRLAEEYLSFINYRSSEIHYHSHLLPELIDRNLDKYFEKNHKLAVETLNANSLPSDETFEYKFIFEKELFYFLNRKLSGRNEKLMYSIRIQKLSYYLTCSYLIYNLKMYIYKITSDRMFKSDQDISFIDEIIDHLSRNKYEDVPEIQIYYNVLQMHMHSGDEHFSRVKELFYVHFKKLHINEKRDIFVNMENYCNEQIRRGNKQYNKELFEIYKMQLKNEVCIENGIMPVKFYKNTAFKGIDLGEFKWSEKFINTFKINLPRVSGESVFNLCNAYLCFNKGNYESSLDLLSKAETEDVFMKLDVKNMMLMIYYETRSFEPALSMVDSYKHFLTGRILVNEKRREIYKEFIKFMNKILKCIISPLKKDLKKLRSDAKASSTLLYKDWFMKKIDELENDPLNSSSYPHSPNSLRSHQPDKPR